MRHLKPYKIYESDNVCTTCNGSGKVGREINMFGAMGSHECDECDAWRDYGAEVTMGMKLMWGM